MKLTWKMSDHDDLMEWKRKIQDKWVDEFNREIYTKKNLQNYTRYKRAWGWFIGKFQNHVILEYYDNEQLSALYKKYYDPEEKREIDLIDEFFYGFVYEELHDYMPYVDQVFDEDGELRERHKQ